MGTTGNADLAGRHNQELTFGKLVRMVLQHCREAFDLAGERSTKKPEEQDARVGQCLVEDELAKITVGNQQNALLSPE